MKVTYTATNRAHHYPYALELHRLNCLHAFVSGFSRLSPRAAFPEVGDLLKRRDLLQTLYVLSAKFGAPSWLTAKLNVLSNAHLDLASHTFAKDSDVFLYYRTTGMRTARKLKREGRPVMCVMEEVNSHVSLCHRIMKEEYLSLKVGDTPEEFPDEEDRLKAYQEADFILCPSEWVKNSFIRQGFAPEKIIKNPYGFTLNKQPVAESQPAGGKSGVFRILFVGQVHYRKGLRYLVEAFRSLDHPNKELVIVGPKTAVTGLENTSLPDGVTFTGELKGQDLINAYKEATVFCLPSLEEGLALVMGEALSYGLPIVATNQTGAEDLFEDGKQGWIVDPASTDALLTCFRKLADQPELLQEMSQSARERCVSLGGWQKSGEGLVRELTANLEKWRNATT